MGAVETGMGVALAGLRALAGSRLLERTGQRERVERLVHDATRRGFGAATTAARTFSRATSDGEPRRQAPTGDDRGLFDLTPSDEQQMLVDATRQLADDLLRPAAREADDACAVPEGLATQVHDLGLLHLGLPPAYGGVLEERSATTAVLAAETLAHGDLGLAAALLAPAAVPTALALHGDADQQQRYLPAWTEPDPPLTALALMEPRAAGDPLAPTTRAERVPGGYALTGTKSSVLHAAAAELFLVSALLDGRPALFLVEGGTEGLRHRPDPLLGVRAGATGTLLLDDVQVGGDALVGAGDPAVVADLVARGRIAWAALAAGTCRAVLDHVVPYVTSREAFGEPIAHRQSVAFMVADVGVELDGLRLTALRAAARADRGLDARHQAALARRLTATRAVAVGSDGVQLLGGHGFVKEHPVERWFRDLRTAGVLEGALVV